MQEVQKGKIEEVKTDDGEIFLDDLGYGAEIASVISKLDLNNPADLVIYYTKFKEFLYKFKEFLYKYEGVRHKAYDDADPHGKYDPKNLKGKPTIGGGFNLGKTWRES